jgi:transcriptional regulator with GAF, ATPase, and Fis domain
MQEARDFEDLRAELDARMRELAGEAKSTTPESARKEAGQASTAPAAEPPMEVTEGSPPGKLRNSGFLTLEEVERDYIVEVLRLKKWRISGPKGAALVLGLNPSTLRSRMKKLGISRDISRNREI